MGTLVYSTVAHGHARGLWAMDLERGGPRRSAGRHRGERVLEEDPRGGRVVDPGRGGAVRERRVVPLRVSRSCVRYAPGPESVFLYQISRTRFDEVKAFCTKRTIFEDAMPSRGTGAVRSRCSRTRTWSSCASTGTRKPEPFLADRSEYPKSLSWNLVRFT